MLDSIEIETAANPRWAVLWLHGLGADGHDFEPIVPQLVARDWPAIRFVFPHAPVRPVTVNGGMRMRAWYDILGLEIANRQDEPGIRDSIRHVERLIDRESLRGVDESRLILAGFSQGGAIALAAGVRHRRTLAGIVALSTYLPLGDRTEPELHAANRNTPVWFGHGELDPVVPARLGQMSCEWLRARGYPVEWHTWPMPHSVCAEEIDALRDWLSARFRSAD